MHVRKQTQMETATRNDIAQSCIFFLVKVTKFKQHSSHTTSLQNHLEVGLVTSQNSSKQKKIIDTCCLPKRAGTELHLFQNL